MTVIKGSSGKSVEIQVYGLSEVIKRLSDAGKEIKLGADFGVVRAGTFIEEEVKESIMGRRAEPQSVDTGNLANSIQFEKTGEAEGIVKSRPTPYPGTSTTTEDVALFMEMGTSRNPNPRYHFTNTKERNQGKIKEIIEIEVKKAL